MLQSCTYMPTDKDTAQAFATSWNNLPEGSVYTRDQFIDWMGPLTQADFVGNGKPVSVLDLTEVMLKVAGSELPIEYQPKDATFGTYRVAHTEKMQRLLPLENPVTLEEGLQRTYEWVCAERG